MKQKVQEEQDFKRAQPLCDKRVLELLQNSENDEEELKIIVQKVLECPNVEEALFHREANRLGANDIGFEEKSTQLQIEGEHCKCCGLLQDATIPFCTDIANIPNTGLSTQLYFTNLKFIIFNLSTILLLNGVYSMATNYYCSQTKSIILRYSLHSKQNCQSHIYLVSLFVTIEEWLILAQCVLIAILTYYFKERNQKLVDQIDKATVTASDFTVMLTNVPSKTTKQDILTAFYQYWDQNLNSFISKSAPQDQVSPQSSLSQGSETLSAGHGSPVSSNIAPSESSIESFNIYSTNKRFTNCIWAQKPDIVKVNFGKSALTSTEELEDIELNELETKITSRENTLLDLISYYQKQSKLPFTKAERLKLIQIYILLKAKKQHKASKMLVKAQKMLEKEERDTSVTAFVTFQQSHSVSGILQERGGCLKLLSNQLSLTLPSGIKVGIQQAPQPGDLLWENLGIEYRGFRKMATFTVSMGLLGGSLVSSYLLTAIQLKSQSTIWILMISTSIAAINVLLTVAINILTNAEKDPTITMREASMALKTILAQLINSILVPCIVSIYQKKNIYGSNGLIEDVLFISCANTSISILSAVINWAYIKNVYSNCQVQNSIEFRFSFDQQSLNETLEYPEFDLGSKYIFPISNFLFSCFFAPLQPIVCLIFLFGITIWYYIQKYTLLYRSSRPVAGSNHLNRVVGNLAVLGGSSLAVGSFLWLYLFANNQSNNTILFHFVTMGFSLLVFLYIFSNFVEMKTENSINLKYTEQIHNLTNDYDRSNPLTSFQASNQFANLMRMRGKKSRNFAPRDSRHSISHMLPLNNLMKNPVKFICLTLKKLEEEQDEQKSNIKKQAKPIKPSLFQTENNPSVFSETNKLTIIPIDALNSQKQYKVFDKEAVIWGTFGDAPSPYELLKY